MDDLSKKLLFISRNMAIKHYRFIKEKGFIKIGFGQIPMAKIILDYPGVYADDICKELELDKATVAIGLKRMLIVGLIKRETDENDKRKKKLYPTERLLESAKVLDEHINRRIKELTEGFSKDDLENLDKYLDRMKDNLLKD